MEIIFPSSVYNLGNEFYLNHLGFGLTMISFIFFLLYFYSQNLIEQAKYSLKKEKYIFSDYDNCLRY